jgi:hypothetical protein
MNQTLAALDRPSAGLLNAHNANAMMDRAQRFSSDRADLADARRGVDAGAEQWPPWR